jgi:phasin family protein
MVSRTRKSAAKRTRRAAPKKASTANAAMSATSARRGLGEVFGNMQLTQVAGKLIEGRRRDLDAILQANKKSYQGLQSVVERQTSMLKESIAQWQSVARMMSASGPRESISKLDELAKQSFGMAIANIRELAELTARSQADAFNVVRQRIRENIEEVTQLLNRR